MTASQSLKSFTGKPYPMGISVTGSGRVNFAASFPDGENSGVVIYRKDMEETRIPFSRGIRTGKILSMQIDGLQNCDFQYNYYSGDEIITDPYTQAVYGNEKYGEVADPLLKGGLCAHEYDWEEDFPLLTPESETIIYLIHPRGFTRHDSSEVCGKGTFDGVREKIPYLKELGITAVEMMPSYEFAELEGQEKINFWGYKKGYYFAPKRSYCSSDMPDIEFKDMVKALHRCGIEIIMQFYFPEVRYSFIRDVLRYWVSEYHIDGFHLMGTNIPVALLAEDEILADTKLFYENDYHDGFMIAARLFFKTE